MNILKFRAWHIESKVMLDVIGLTFHPVLEIYCGENEHGEELLFTADEVTLMQSTGLTDKNGVEIFCDDIVKVEQDGIEKIHKVYWGGDYPAFELSPDLGCECNGFSYIVAENVSIEVIGSIHANKELMI